MHKMLFALLTLVSLSATAADKISTFHRLLIFNDSNELLLVKIKGPGVWVTPGWYQDGTTMLHEGLKKTAAEYGLAITDTKLRGVFTLTNQRDNSLSIRNFFTMKSTDKVAKMPKYIEEVKWLTTDEAKQLMNFPHINLLINEVMNHPNHVRSGGVYRFKENGQEKLKIVEPFQNMN